MANSNPPAFGQRHRHHSVMSMTDLPAKQLFRARQSIYKHRSKLNLPTNLWGDDSLSPQNTLRGGHYTENDHYTPNWFKMSIRTVDRDNVISTDEETQLVTSKIDEVLKLRDKWLYKPRNTDHIGAALGDGDICIDVEKMKHKLPPSIENKYECKFEKGIMKITSKISGEEKFKERSFTEYLKDLRTVMKLVSLGPAKTLCYRRLQILQSRFTLHNWLNDSVEVLEVKSIPHRDFYNVRKIDNHVHHSACMHQKHLLRFIKNKLVQEPDTVCHKTKDGKEQTLKEVFDDIGMTGHELNIDALDMHAHQETFQRFDKFNAKYNPVGKAQLRTIFLKIDNLIKGRFLAEITKEVAQDLVSSKYQFAEYRLSIYGRKKEEWDIMGDWICNNGLYSKNVRWMIQMPRIYYVYKKINLPSIQCFNDLLQNFFEPLFEVTLNPSSHPSLHLFLQMMVGFDSVDDESHPESKQKEYPDPSEWTTKHNPPYIYYAYYTYINILKLNRLREERGMNTFAFRPHCGEAGGFDHLGAAFLLANSINHGIRLKQAPVLQYLYYLKQIGLAMSPLSNNILFEEYDSNPLPAFFKRGLNVALSTDDPLLIHYTKDALLEEYSIAAQVYNLSSIDLCELARNSVLQCGFDQKFKEHCIGTNYHLRGSSGNNIYQSNVPDARLDYRASILEEEENFIKYAGYPQEHMKSHSINSVALNASIKGLFQDTSVTIEEEKEDDVDMLLGSLNVKGKKAPIAQDEGALRDEWALLNQEKHKLKVIRQKLTDFVDKNKQSGNNIVGLDELEEILTKQGSPMLTQSNSEDCYTDPVNIGVDKEKKQNSVAVKKESEAKKTKK